MFEKNMKLSYLLDFYGEVLDEHTREIIRAYYNDDLSLAEIAEGEGISRQGIRHIVKKGEEQLLFLEDRLALAAHSLDVKKAQGLLSRVLKHLEDSDAEGADEAKQSLIKAMELIEND